MHGEQKTLQSEQNAQNTLQTADEEYAEINEVNFKDPVFRICVGSGEIDTDEPKGMLSQSERGSVKSITLQGKGIETLKGIEYFAKLAELDCSYNLLRVLDMSNQLTELDVGKSTILTTLNCLNNQLTILDLDKNTMLCKLV